MNHAPAANNSLDEQATAMRLPGALGATLRAMLPGVASRVVDAIKDDVPGYAASLDPRREAQIERAVALALSGFVEAVGRGESAVHGIAAFGDVAAGAYALGRGEARSGRSMEALLSAYRIGARVSWQQIASVALGAGLPAETVAALAAGVFSYIDDLSAASASGHSEELTASGVTRRRNLDRLAHLLLSGEPVEQLARAAARAGWAPPRSLTVVLLPAERARAALSGLDPATLVASEETAETLAQPGTAILLVPDAGTAGRDGQASDEQGRRPRADVSGRARLLRTVEEARDDGWAVVGPAREWTAVATSFARAARALGLADASTQAGAGELVNTEARLVQLVCSADPLARDDLARATFAPLDDLRPAVRERLLATLRSWLLHQGRRDAVAAELFVHPQTVRYRMGQLRELLGERLDDPRWCEAAVVVLATW